MNKKFLEILICLKCKKKLSRKGNKLVCYQKHSYNVEFQVPVMVDLNRYQREEAKAWEDDWRKGISKKSLSSYDYNMKIFTELGFWEESSKAVKNIPSKNNFRVLDLGCGNGESTSNVKGDLVVGLDLSEGQLVKAKRKHSQKEYVVGDAHKLPFKANSFDLVVSINLLHHLPQPEVALKEIHRVLKKKGTLFTVDPNLFNPIGFLGRGLFKLLNLKTVFPKFPQFALGDDERQYSKKQYYELFDNSPFKDYVITPHRIEKLLFFATILIPGLIKLPGYKSILIFASNVGNRIVQHQPFDQICYFWRGRLTKS